MAVMTFVAACVRRDAWRRSWPGMVGPHEGCSRTLQGPTALRFCGAMAPNTVNLPSRKAFHPSFFVASLPTV